MIYDIMFGNNIYKSKCTFSKLIPITLVELLCALCQSYSLKRYASFIDYNRIVAQLAVNIFDASCWLC